MRRQELIFALLQAQADKKGEIYGEGVLEVFAPFDLRPTGLLPTYETVPKLGKFEVEFFGNTGTRLWVLSFNNAHNWEHYGNLVVYFRANGMKMKPVVIESTPELTKAYLAGRCDVLTSDASQLASHRSAFANPDDHMILPEIISKEPLCPAVRHGDDQWYDIVNFSVLAMIAAEELGVTSKNVDAMLKSKDPKIQRFLGVNPGNGKALGLDEKWAYNIVKPLTAESGSFFGGLIGARLSIDIKERYLQILVSVVILIAAAKLFFDSLSGNVLGF